MTSRVVVALLLACSACAASNKSRVEQNQQVDTGRRDFDEYFQEVDDLRDAVDELGDEQLYAMREPLVEALELDPDVGLPALLDATKKRVGKLRDFGITMDLQLTPAPRVLVDHGQMGSNDDKGLSQAIQESAVRALEFFKKHQELLERAAQLEQKRAEVAERIDKLSPQEDKGMIETEIVGAGRVLGDSEKKLLGNTHTISHFLVGLTQASDSGARGALDDKCERAIAQYKEQSEKPAPKRGFRGRPAAPRPAPPRPVPVARPAPRPLPPPAAPPRPPPPTRPAAGGDFEM
jgi:hypothetical protein